MLNLDKNQIKKLLEAGEITVSQAVSIQFNMDNKNKPASAVTVSPRSTSESVKGHRNTPMTQIEAVLEVVGRKSMMNSLEIEDAINTTSTFEFNPNNAYDSCFTLTATLSSMHNKGTIRRVKDGKYFRYYI